MKLDDKDLLSDYVRQKDAEAFAALVERYQSLVYATSYRQLGNTADAEEVTQDVFLSLATRACQISSGNLGGWLYRSALNAASSKLRADLARTARERARAVSDHRSDTSTEWRQIEEVLDACLAELSQDSRELLIQRFFVNRSQRELAETLGVDQATISRRLKKAVDQLRRHMANRGVRLTVAVIVAELAEQASISSVSANLSIGLVKIGVAGVGEKSLSASSLATFPFLWPAIGILIVALVVPAALLIQAFAGSSGGPTSSVVSLARPLPMALVAELTRLDYTVPLSSSAVAMNDGGQIALFTDRPKEQAGVYVIDKNRARCLRRLPEHGRRSLAIAPGPMVAVNYDRRLDVIDGNSTRSLIESAEIDIPPSINAEGWVVFVEAAPVNRIRLATGDKVRTLHEADDRFTRFGLACINDEGQVAFRAETSGGDSGFFLSRQGDVAVVAETGNTFTDFRPSFDFNNHGQLAFVAQHNDGTEVLCVGDDAGFKQVARSGDLFASILHVSLNDAGMVAFTARKPGDPADLPMGGLYLWDGTRIVEVLARGQRVGI